MNSARVNNNGGSDAAVDLHDPCLDYGCRMQMVGLPEMNLYGAFPAGLGNMVVLKC